MATAILAFSGGLDTTFCIPYLLDQGYDVVTATVNTGGFSSEELLSIEARAKELGSKKHVTIDAQQELYNRFASYIIKANYLKGGVYPACVGPERIVIAEEIARLAKEEGTTVICHGSTGAGNDQVRFDVALKALVPNVTILAPIRDEGLTRQQEFDLLQKHGIDFPETNKEYSINVGLLGTTIGGKETTGTEDPIPDDVFPTVVPVADTPDAQQITITFKEGLPTALNGKGIAGVDLIQELNTLGAAHGFGKDYHIGTTIIGLKGRIAFEAPALKMLIKAHTELEKLTLTSKQLFWKNHLGTLYGDMVHEGLYFEPLMADIQAFLNSASTYVTGEVTLKLHKGSLSMVGATSPHSLFNSKLGTYGEEAQGWTGLDAKGFCKLHGLEGTSAFLTHSSL